MSRIILYDYWRSSACYRVRIALNLKGVDYEQRQVDLRTDEHKISGCQSQVWLIPGGDARRMEFLATSDSSIVSGLIALLLRVYSGRPAAEILATEPRFIEAIGLARHLSPTRSNGLAAMLARVRQHALEASARSSP